MNGVPDIHTIGIGNANVRVNPIQVTGIGINISDARIPDTRIWINDPPQAVPNDPPVVIHIGKPIVNIPGCVETHKESSKQLSKNKALVNDDPKGNIVLCDSGMPSFNPMDYERNKLRWETFYGDQDAPEAEGVKTDPPEPPIPETPEPPVTPPTKVKDEECPPPNARRVGDLSQSGEERVSGYEWNSDKTECITLWEPIPFVDKYLPAANVVTTTAGIAVVATTSALLAKPLADLLLKIVKPVVKKTIAKVKKMLGKKEPVVSKREKILAQRERNRAVMELRKALKK